ncbi:hypothetical protein HanIR_Chr08g0352571 [Helianthus annuus]|nr:hypothetical protein HanIR_Chr08g0352571 [Helianthus annuus]
MNTTRRQPRVIRKPLRTSPDRNPSDRSILTPPSHPRSRKFSICECSNQSFRQIHRTNHLHRRHFRRRRLRGLNT